MEGRGTGRSYDIETTTISNLEKLGPFTNILDGMSMFSQQYERLVEPCCTFKPR